MASPGIGSPVSAETEHKGTVLPALLETFQERVAAAGVVGVSEVVLGILGLAGLASSLFGDSAIRAGAVVAALAAMLGLLVVLAANRKGTRHRAEVAERLLRRYCATLEDRYQHMPRTTEWRQVITIDRKGNSSEQIRCTIVADSDYVDFFSMQSGAGWDWPTRLQNRVRYHVRFAMNGPEGGTHPDVTHAWPTRDRVIITAHLSQPIPKGGTASFDAKIWWPLKCEPLVRRHVEEFTRFFPVPVEVLHYTVVLPKGCQGYVNVIGLDHAANDYEIRNNPNGHGCSELSLVARNVPAGRRVGMRIDLM